VLARLLLAAALLLSTPELLGGLIVVLLAVLLKVLVLAFARVLLLLPLVPEGFSSFSWSCSILAYAVTTNNRQTA
jgi:hypothetical protein